MMDMNDKDTKLIQDFFNHKLSGKKLEDFDKRIQTDEAFSDKVAVFVALQSIMAEDTEEDTPEEAEEEPTPPKIPLPYYKIVLGILGLFLFLFGIYHFFKAPSLPEIEINDLKKELRHDISKDKKGKIFAGTNDEDGALFLLSDDKDSIHIGIQKLEMTIKEPDCKRDDLQYYLGSAYLVFEKNYPKAIKMLTCPIDPNSYYKTKAAKMLITAYTLNEQIDKANDVLKKDYLKLQIYQLPPSIQKQLID